MDQDFIEALTVQTFDSTMKNKGTAVGAYQYKQILSNISGYISVSKKIGEISCFTAILPLSEETAVIEQTALSVLTTPSAPAAQSS